MIQGLHPGRQHESEVAVFDSVGFAIEDFSALRYLARSVDRTHIARDIDLVADPLDPKDLYGYIAESSVRP